MSDRNILPAAIHVGRLEPQDLPFARGLSVQAGWNQLDADWLRMLSMEPSGCLLATWHDQPAGTTVCCTFDSVAWLALVLVEQSLRGQGIGRSLVQAGLDYASKAGSRTVRLDATPLGRPVYERLGFRPQYELARWSGIPRFKFDVHQQFSIRQETVGNLDQSLLTIDRQATQTNRDKLLQKLFLEREPWVARDGTGQAVGYLASRPGRLAVQIGPGCGDRQAVTELLRHAISHYQTQSLFADIPSHNQHLNEIAAAAGLVVARNLMRMSLGEPIVEDARTFHISSGPELG